MCQRTLSPHVILTATQKRGAALKPRPRLSSNTPLCPLHHRVHLHPAQPCVRWDPGACPPGEERAWSALHSLAVPTSKPTSCCSHPRSQCLRQSHGSCGLREGQLFCESSSPCCKPEGRWASPGVARAVGCPGASLFGAGPIALLSRESPGKGESLMPLPVLLCYGSKIQKVKF